MKIDFMHEVRPSGGVFPLLEDGFYKIALYNGTAFKVCLIRQDGWLYVGVFGKGFYRFSGEVFPSYLKEKMPTLLSGDCRNMCDFINDQLGVKVERFGSYR